MLDVDVLYLSKNNRSTNIYTIHGNKIVTKTITNIFNDACLKSLSTLEGRVDAVKQVYKIYKFTPVYISHNLIFQPLYSTRSWIQIFINICNVKNIIKEDNKTKIIFINDDYILSDISITRVKKYMKNCLKLRKNQFNYMKEEIYYGKEKY